jgi:hypothetical protein
MYIYTTFLANILEIMHITNVEFVIGYGSMMLLNFVATCSESMKKKF